MKTLKSIFALIIILFVSVGVNAQESDSDKYIEKYKLIAIQHRFSYNIPAAITLAQGMLESGHGKSRLATEANNHFGIKCHSDWKGKRIYKDDDAKDECFRVYDNVEESYTDHAIFLSTKSRYAFLFEYKITDYKSWAKGLKKAGYATNPQYPQRLIDLIERYDLAQYDKMSEADFKKLLLLDGQDPAVVLPDDTNAIASVIPLKKNKHKGPHSILYRNRVKYIIVHEGEGVLQIAQLFNVSPNQIYKYNDMAKGSQIKVGMMLYLQPKRRKGDLKYHSVKKGQSLWEISQIHGIKLKWLLKRNNLKSDAKINVGDKLNLKKTKKLK